MQQPMSYFSNDMAIMDATRKIMSGTGEMLPIIYNLAIMLIVTTIIQKLMHINFSNTIDDFNYFVRNTRMKFDNIFLIATGKKRIKRIINQFTYARNENQIIKAVVWYVSTQINQYDTSMMNIDVDDQQEYNNYCRYNLDDDKQWKNIRKMIANQSTFVQTTFEGHEIEISLLNGTHKLVFDKIIDKPCMIVEMTTLITYGSDEDPLDSFTRMCVKKYIKQQGNINGRPNIYYNVKAEWKERSKLSCASIKHLVLKNCYDHEIVKIIDQFNANEHICEMASADWSLGFLLYGVPGCGKTMTIKTIANYTNRNIYMMKLQDIENTNMFRTLMTSINVLKSIIVIEDIDAMTDIVKQRDINVVMIDDDKKKHMNQKQDEEPKLTLQDLLEEFQGITSNCHGRIIIMTSNHKEKLDSALIRIGRMDHHIEYFPCDRDMISRMYVNIFKEQPDEDLIMALPENILYPSQVTKHFIHHINNPYIALKTLVDNKTEKIE